MVSYLNFGFKEAVGDMYPNCTRNNNYNLHKKKFKKKKKRKKNGLCLFIFIVVGPVEYYKYKLGFFSHCQCF